MLKAHPDGNLKQASCPNEMDGFSLIAISILLTVAALVFASLLPGQQGAESIQKTLNNGKKLERIEEAMRSFMATNGRRPCPADGQYAENTANFGKEAATPGTCTGGTPAAPLGPDAGTGLVVGGVIPTETLGLPDEYQYDEQGHRFTYIVDLRATTATGTNYCGYLQNSIKYAGAVPGIAIYNTATAGTLIDHTMYAYISHGASGYGAYPAQGAATPAGRINSGSTDVDMQVNAGVDALGASSTFTYSTANFGNIKIQKDRVNPNLTPGDTGFDDLLWYRPDTKNTCCLGVSCLPTGFVVPPVGTVEYASLSVATGDVNGDGIADLVIGAPWGNSTGGVAYVVFGTKLGFPDPLPLASLNGANGFELIGEAGGNFGTKVATGDVNGDGIADIIVSASGSSPGYTYVVFGKRGTWTTPQTLNPGYGKVIDGTQGVRFDGTGTGVTSLATGDVNSDGYADVVMGAPQQNSNAGYTYVVFGKSTSASTFLPSTTVTTTSGSKAITPASYTGLMVGQTLTSANIPPGVGWNGGTTIHDCNGGITTVGTVCTGTINLSANATATAAGTVMTVAATPVTSIGSGTLIDGTQGVRFDGVTGGDYAGWSVATGDVNGDGYADVVIGADGANGVVGYTYVVFGKSATWGSAGNVVLNTGYGNLIDGTQGVRFDGKGAWAAAGVSVATGDVNGDRIADVVISAEGANTDQGYFYVVFGKNSATFLANTTVTTTNAATAITPASYTGLMVGETLTSANIPTGTTIHDCNGGTTTVGTVCTASINLSANATATAAGTALTVATMPLVIGSGTLIDGTQGVRFDGTTVNWNDPMMVATGDINGDGYADVIITSPYSNSDAGYTYVVFGKSASWGSAGNVLLNTGAGNLIDGTQGTRFDGATANDLTGWSVATGDINGDGIPDLIIGTGTPGGLGVNHNGYVYVYFGHKNTSAHPWPNPNYNLGGL
jgi:hypothetical protein